MTGDTKPGDALADQTRDEFDRNRRERELTIERLRIRAEMRSSHEEDEDTGVIHQRAAERVAVTKSDPPKAAKGIAHVLGAVRTPAQALVALAIVAAIVVLILHGWKP
jgi:hypothetical protein